MARYCTLATTAILTLSVFGAATGYTQMSDKYQPNPE